MYMLKRISPISLNNNQIFQIATLIHSKWAKKDQSVFTRDSRNWQGSTPTPELYAEQLRQIREKGCTPIFILEDEGGRVVGSLITLRWKGALPTKYKELVNNDYEGKDWHNGETLLCRCISVSEEAKGGSRALIVDGAAAYAKEEMANGTLRYAIAYSRPSDFGTLAVPNGIGIMEYLKWTVAKCETKGADSTEQRRFYDAYVAQFGPTGMADVLRSTGRRHVDQTLGMHLSYGAEIMAVYENGCPNDRAAGGYNIMMDYTPMLAGMPGRGIDPAFMR
ncbi:MAG: hypothetical protein WC263_02495 [Candidatus Micrarchaeia archaeon]